jgi:hypothetical protein
LFCVHGLRADILFELLCGSLSLRLNLKWKILVLFCLFSVFCFPFLFFLVSSVTNTKRFLRACALITDRKNLQARVRRGNI